MSGMLEKAGEIWRQVCGLLSLRLDREPIDSLAKLEAFAVTRSAYLAQKTLYGYVKARMGIRYPAMFEDAKMIASLNIAKMNVFAACLSDLTIYAVAQVTHDRPVGNAERQSVALEIFRAGLRDNAPAAPDDFSAPDAVAAFTQRLGATDWPQSARQPDNFTASPPALFRWAPIADNLKKFDREIIDNSVKFAWRDIREQFGQRVDADAVYADWQNR